jgi:hypothetical protein
MKNCTLALALGTAVVTTVLSLVAESAHALTFRFDGLRTDDDSFDLILTTEDTLITESYPSYTDPLWGPLAGTSPAYTFTGYRVTSVSGTYTDESITYPIVGLLPVDSIVSAAGDQIPHSPTDNLFNPDGGFAPDFPLLPVGDTFRKFSFGGIAFNIQEGTLIEPYQVFARSDFNSTWSNPPGFSDYAGCPGSCVGVVEVVPEPTSTLSLLALGTLGAASTLKRKLKPSQSTEKETTKVS